MQLGRRARWAPLASVTPRPTSCVSASQLAVAVGPGERRIGPGEPLELLCNVSGALPPPGRHAAYSVGWEMAPAGAPGPGRLVAQLDTEGVGSLGPGYEGRHIAMEKVASRTYRLRLEAARPGDAGTYRCLAKAYVRGSGARLREAASARSRPLPVHVREEGEAGGLQRPLPLGPLLRLWGHPECPGVPPADPSPSDPWPLLAGVALEAVAWLAGGTVYRGETASLLCNISVRGGPPGLRLAASWWVERPADGELSAASAQLVGGVGQDGVAELGVRPGGSPVSVELVGPRSHRLRLHGLGPEDEGVYHCAPSAWVQHADDSWYQAGSARSGPVTVYPYTHGEWPQPSLLLLPCCPLSPPSHVTQRAPLHSPPAPSCPRGLGGGAEVSAERAGRALCEGGGGAEDTLEKGLGPPWGRAGGSRHPG